MPFHVLPANYLINLPSNLRRCRASKTVVVTIFVVVIVVRVIVICRFRVVRVNASVKIAHESTTVTVVKHRYD